MFAWWFIGSIGCLSVGMIYCQGNAPELADIEPPQEAEVPVKLTVVDSAPPVVANETNSLPASEGTITVTVPTTTQTPELFSCHECTSCNSKSDFKTQVCEPGINMCYKMHHRINNVSRIIRGCSKSKGHCTAFNDDQVNSIDSITCCTTLKCNEATQFKPLFFLSTSSLLSILIIIINI